MAWNDFEVTAVGAPPGGGNVRTIVTNLQVTDGITDAPVQLRQDGIDVPGITPDASGRAYFQALDSLVVRVEGLGWSELIESVQQKQAKGTFTGDLDAAADLAIDRAETAGRLITGAAADATYVPLTGADSEYLRPATATATYATLTQQAAIEASVATKANANAVPTLEEQLFVGRIGSLVAGTEHIMLVAPFALRVDSLNVAATTSIPADGANFHSIRWRRIKAGVTEEIVRKATISGAGNEPITAFQDWNYDNLAFGAAQDLAKGDLLTVIVVTAGTPPALNGVTATVRYHAL